MITVLLVDDQALLRAGIAALLELEADITVIGQADDGQTALDMVASLRPDVVLMDIRMPTVDGIEATRRIAADTALGHVHVVMLTTFALDEYIFEAIRAGAAGFLVKNSEPDELTRGVRAAAAGDALLTPSVTRRLISEYAARAKPAPAALPSLNALTDREREYSPSSPPDCPTTRSPTGSPSARSPPRPTSPARWPNSPPATAPNSSSPPTNLAWCNPVGPADDISTAR